MYYYNSQMAEVKSEDWTTFGVSRETHRKLVARKRNGETNEEMLRRELSLDDE